MENTTLQTYGSKFVSQLLTTIRLISIYPAKHPLIVNALKTLMSYLESLLTTEDVLELAISPDNRVILNQFVIQEKGQGTVNDFISLFKKLEVESLIFSRGLTVEEMDNFVKFFISDKEKLKSKQNLNTFFEAQGIKHIKARQYEYLKIEKGKEATLLEGKLKDVELLKKKIKDFSQKKISEPADIQTIQEGVFNLVKEEFKQEGKINSSIKILLKKFILHSSDHNNVLEKLRQALIDFGCPPEQVDSLISRIREEISQPQQSRARITKEDLELLQRQNNQLKEQLTTLRQEIERHRWALEELKKENRKIISEKQRIDNIVHNMAEGMVVVDAEGKIILVNPAAEQLLGITKEDIGKPIRQVIKDEHLLTLTKQITADAEGIVEKDIELVSADESTKRVLRTSSAVVEDNEGRTVGMVTMLNDITRQKEIENLKSQFVASVSHELRTPLVAIEKSISLMLSKAAGEINETQSQFLNIAERNLKRLTALINDLLDLSKLEAGKMVLKRRPVSLASLIQDAIESMLNWAGSKSIALKKEIAQDLPLIELDPDRIIQVLNNLIGNAIKYTPSGGQITVKARFVSQEHCVEVEVEDTGIGIPEEDLDKVFEKFYQAKGHEQTEIKGTGIGLAIVKEIVTLHGGKVWVESQLGKGSRFFFTIPQTGEEDNDRQPN
ncbi:MAG: cell wall metabolism sensor histidine kinase WalK [Candidatus Omnitrophica bacterium]|nr:cell wall metabolism sensor histidine kinase WalK [Candidatus Omnitrophota bacterium]